MSHLILFVFFHLHGNFRRDGLAQAEQSPHVLPMTLIPTLLLIDDDHDLRSALAEQLSTNSEFAIVEAATGAAGLEAATTNRIDLVLLDVDLPDMNGREVCAALRTQGLRVPILMLTGAVSDSDTVAGLDAGANDYITKPFKFAVLDARIRAHLRSFESSDEATLAIGPYAFRPALKMLQTDTRKIKLTDKEAMILKYLYRAGGQVVAREDLLANVWGYNAGVDTHTIETHIYRLRRKIEPGDTPRLLITEAGGYRLGS